MLFRKGEDRGTIGLPQPHFLRTWVSIVEPGAGPKRHARPMPSPRTATAMRGNAGGRSRSALSRAGALPVNPAHRRSPATLAGDPRCGGPAAPEGGPHGN